VLLTTGYAQIPEGEGAGLPRISKPFTQADIARGVAACYRAGRKPAEARRS
jgi:hypothetical protein